MAQRLADNFDKIDDDAPCLKLDNRIRLWKEHLAAMDADVIGLSEVDALSGKHSNSLI